MKETCQNPFIGGIFYFLFSEWLESSNYRKTQKGRLEVIWSNPMLRAKLRLPKALFGEAVHLSENWNAAASLDNLFLCSTAPTRRILFLLSFKRQVRKHLFPNCQWGPGVGGTLHSLGVLKCRELCTCLETKTFAFQSLVCSSVEQFLMKAGSRLSADFFKQLVKFFFLFMYLFYFIFFYW